MLSVPIDLATQSLKDRLKLLKRVDWTSTDYVFVELRADLLQLLIGFLLRALLLSLILEADYLEHAVLQADFVDEVESAVLYEML